MARERIDAFRPMTRRLFDPNFIEPLVSGNLGIVERLRDVAEHGFTPGQAAIAWTLANPAVDGAIVGFRRPDQVGEILGGGGP